MFDKKDWLAVMNLALIGTNLFLITVMLGVYLSRYIMVVQIQIDGLSYHFLNCNKYLTERS